MSNSEHTKIGAVFQKAVQQYFIKKYGSGFELEMGHWKQGWIVFSDKS